MYKIHIFRLRMLFGIHKGYLLQYLSNIQKKTKLTKLEWFYME